MGRVGAVLAAVWVASVFDGVGQGMAQIPTQVGKNHETVRQAFRSLVVRAKPSCVRVFAAGGSEDVALGAIVRADGLILTKASEVTSQPEVLLDDGRFLPGEVIGVNRRHDLMLLKVKAQGLPPIEFRQQGIPALGSLLATPGRGDEPLAIGVVSGGRQTVPPTPGVLGLVVHRHRAGPQVTQVMPESVAERAGVQVGDLITHLDGQPIASCRALVEAVRSFPPGRAFRIHLARDERPVKVTATLVANPRVDPLAGVGRALPRGEQLALSNRRGSFPEVFVHDTMLRPRDCGGPVLDLEGRAVGVNIARTDRTTSYAVPAATVLKVLEERLDE